jgi:hypothetical protein
VVVFIFFFFLEEGDMQYTSIIVIIA